MSGSGARRQHILPAPRGRLIGRERDLVSVRKALLSTAGRLVTLTGAGGCGKTRLALQAASDLVDHFADGVWLVELAALAEPTLVAQAIATALNVPERRGRTLLASLVSSLAGRNLLMVLDNCEHLLDPCAQTVETLLDGCPRVHVLATSREHLRVRHEVRLTVPPLGLPDASLGADAAAALPAAVQLFVERAQAVQPGFEPNGREFAVVGQICTRLDGLPLAIELAAAHVRTLGVDEIAERLQDSFHLLAGGNRTAPPRHQTLKAALDWSHDLVDGVQQRVFRRLGIFAGTWSFELAEAVCAESSDVFLDALTRLVDLSMVFAEHHAGRARYHLLEPVRQYALDQLAACGELETIRRRHALVLVELAEQMEAATRVFGPRRTAAWEALERLYPNLQLALRWSIDEGEVETAFRLASTAHVVWTTRRPASEGLGWLTQVLELPSPTQAMAAHAMAYTTAGRLATQQGRYAQARTFFERALPLARQASDSFVVSAALQSTGVDCVDRGAYAEGRIYLEEALALALAEREPLQEASCRTNLLWLACLQGDYGTAYEWSYEAIRLARTLDDPWSLAWPLQGLGFAACAQGDLERARASLAETEPLWRHAGELYGMAWTHEGLGHVALAEGTYSEAAQRFKNALTLRQELSDLPGIADCLDGIGGVLARRGRQEDGVRLAAAAEALRETLPLALGPLRRDLRERWLAATRASLGEAAIADLWKNGRCIAVEDATAFALSALEPALIGDFTTGVLTRREQAVAALVASGMSNRQIAERLVIAERTAATHVEHILAKLDFTSRTQIGIWAVEHGVKDSSRAVDLTPNR